MQGLMWRAYDSIGFLEYSFVETVDAMYPYYVIRALGGLLYLSGMLIMVYNCWKTIKGCGQNCANCACAKGAANA